MPKFKSQNGDTWSRTDNPSLSSMSQRDGWLASVMWENNRTGDRVILYADWKDHNPHHAHDWMVSFPDGSYEYSDRDTAKRKIKTYIEEDYPNH